METILTLPLVLAVVLVELAVGGTFVAWFLERRGEAPGGFMKLVAAVSSLHPAIEPVVSALVCVAAAGAAHRRGEALVPIAVIPHGSGTRRRPSPWPPMCTRGQRH